MDKWMVLSGPLLRQAVQWAGGVAFGAGILTGQDAAAIIGATTSLVNVGFVVRARIKAGK